MILHMNFLFMTLNMFILPLGGLVTMEEFLNYFVSQEIFVVREISGKLGVMASFFIFYIMQVTFISNCIQMLDLPHFLVKNAKWFIRRLQFKPHADDWYFDLGYYQSYTSTIMMMCLVFSIAMPLMSGFAAVFFFFRYYIEKYNMLFVYWQDFEAQGTLRKSVVKH